MASLYGDPRPSYTPVPHLPPPPPPFTCPDNHIDLTADDDDDDPAQFERDGGRLAKRPRTSESLPQPATAPVPPHCYFAPPIASGAFSAQPNGFHHRPTPVGPLPPHQQSRMPYDGYRPAFAGPSSATQFGLRQHEQQQQRFPGPSTAPPHPQPQAPQTTRQHTKQVIDLTSSPSPPPQPRRPADPFTNACALPPEMAPKTPVCIGQLTVTALILYPVSYTVPHDYNSESEYAPVKLIPEPPKEGAPPTINIRTPTTRGPSGEPVEGETFGVVEQKVATHLGPMLGKGLIRLDGKIRKGRPNLPILPLQVLVYTPKGNIPVVGNFLHQCGLLLDHPSPTFDIKLIAVYPYFNPHSPPQGGFANRVNHRDMRWTSAPSTSSKSVEVQRSQVDDVFKNLKDGMDLEETEPTSDVATKLYPHQKKALTFLLEREGEASGQNGSPSTLWQQQRDLATGKRVWINIVTATKVDQKPPEAKGSILADDMGLGKTITCVSLIASTLASAKAFAAKPLEPPPPLPDNADSLDPSHFSGSVWGMPDVAEPPAGSSKAKVAKAQDKMESNYVRACRIKARSRATLIICPLSTVANWEDQFREHWKGPVTVVGGNGNACALPQAGLITMDTEPEVKPVVHVRDGTPLRIYVYHGNARRPDPAFLADFDAVITTYATLASEFSKQTRSTATADEDEDDNEDSGITEVDERGNPIIKLARKGKKRKKTSVLATAANEVPSPLQSIHWFRVVLDEAHSIKETSTVGCRASCDLMADRRLCLTGTPVQNKLDDVFALVKFLRLSPLDDKAAWTECIGSPVKFGQELGIQRLQALMKCITLRRTKESKTADGKNILSLPPRKDELRYLKFDAQEQEIYDRFFNESKAEFTDLSNKNEIMKNYVGILQRILRLRQICDHFELVDGKEFNQAGDSSLKYDDIVAAIEKEGFTLSRANAIFSILREAATTQCVECAAELSPPIETNECPEGEPPSTSRRTRKLKNAAASSSRGPTRANSPSAPRIVLTKCQHLFCFECYCNSVCPGWPAPAADQYWRQCSICQTALAPTDALEIKCDISERKKPVKREKRQKGVGLENFRPSSKVTALINDLIKFSRLNPHSANYDNEIQFMDNQGRVTEDGIIKTVVFSQWTSMLDKIEDALEVAGIRYDRLDGTMKRDERTRAMDALKFDPGCEVLLVSLKAGGVGLNLTAAQRVYLMDPYWNPAVENQAVDRIHRLGQTRPVQTIKFIIENSIEARLLEVQKKKTELANLTLGAVSKSENMARRLEELRQLFDVSPGSASGASPAQSQIASSSSTSSINAS